MRLARYKSGSVEGIGLVRGNTLLDVTRAYSLLFEDAEYGLRVASAVLPPDMLELIQGGDETFKVLQDLVERFSHESRSCGRQVEFSLDEVELLAPIPRPPKIICVGLNYASHAKETGKSIPSQPVLFSKYATAVTGPDSYIVLPPVSTQVDYEAELAVVIGKRGKNIPREDALDYVFGYTCFNDVSARDLQFMDGQWMKGKTCDTFAPMGPWLVTKDEISDPHGLDIKLRLNGQLMQHGNTGDFIFDIPTLISFISSLFTLEPGDVVATGTPSGVGFAREPQVFLKPGDVTEVDIERIGVLRNTVKREV